MGAQALSLGVFCIWYLTKRPFLVFNGAVLR